MKLVRVFVIALTGLLGTAAAGSSAEEQFHARLTGFREVPANSTVASGEFKAEIINDTTIAYELTYSGLEAPITQAHIHFGQRFVAAGIALWLCQIPKEPLVAPPAANPFDPTGLAPTCPQEAQGPTTVKGNLTAANLIGPAGQGILEQNSDRASEFAQILKAIRAGVTYTNVHTSKFPGGEIRGQNRAVKVETQDPKSPTSTSAP
jgi:hypothetical protein